MYKIIKDNKVIDVVETPCFVKFLTAGHVAITDKTSAQGIVGSDGETVYSFIEVDRPNTTVVKIKEITPEEFSSLSELLNSDQEVVLDESALNQVRQTTIKRLSDICNNKIISGFSIVLSDGKTYNFKLTIEDQLNLTSIENQLNSGIKTFVYHASNQPCRVFMKNDMSKIIRAFRKHVLYHTTYFNIAKQYINTLTDPEKISTFTYGTDVSKLANSQAILQILRDGE
jgi:hypothetical protein